MSRIRKAKGKIVRRLGVNIFEMPKYDALLQRKNNPPGQILRRRKKISNFGLQLLEKQKLRYAYGLSERQFRGIYEKAKNRPGKTGDNILVLLESRLDNVVFRLGFARSRSQARQMVNHGHITLNNRKETIPSRFVVPGDNVAVKDRKASKKMAREAGVFGFSGQPAWISVDQNNLSGRINALPDPSQLNLPVDTQRIIEYYAR